MAPASCALAALAANVQALAPCKLRCISANEPLSEPAGKAEQAYPSPIWATSTRGAVMAPREHAT
jgi:hypothetical protein